VSVRPEQRTSFVVITASWGNPRFVARLANEYARVGRRRTNDLARARFARAQRSLQDRFRAVSRVARRHDRNGDPQARDDRFLMASLQDRISRLESVRQIARPARIETVAEIPNIPVSPRPVRDTLLGALLGLTLGIVVAFLRDAIDRKMRTREDVHEVLGYPLLGTVSRKAMGMTALTIGDSFPRQDLESFRVLRANLDFLNPDAPIKALVVTSAVPEEGKSTVATTLAGVSAASGKRTALVEFDLRRPSLARRLGISPSPGVTEYLRGHVSLADITQEVVLTPPVVPSIQQGNGREPQEAGPFVLACMMAGELPPNPAELMTSRRMRDLIAELREAYDLLVIDSAPILPVVDTLQLLPLMDGILLCVESSRTTREEAGAVKAALDRAPERTTGIVTTGVRPGDETAYDYYSYVYQY
jgi:receptor protein-tyrosine kinase